jgi:hypothetical protein
MTMLMAERAITESWTTLEARVERVTEQTIGLARRLAEGVANAADADQWTINLVGLTFAREGEPEALFPETWLRTLNGGRPARYRMTLLLQAYGRPVGTIRLATIRPSGFTDQQVRAARILANRAGIMIADAVDHRAAVESLARERHTHVA